MQRLQSVGASFCVLPQGLEPLFLVVVLMAWLVFSRGIRACGRFYGERCHRTESTSN